MDCTLGFQQAGVLNNFGLGTHGRIIARMGHDAKWLDVAALHAAPPVSSNSCVGMGSAFLSQGVWILNPKHFGCNSGLETIVTSTDICSSPTLAPLSFPSTTLPVAQRAKPRRKRGRVERKRKPYTGTVRPVEGGDYLHDQTPKTCAVSCERCQGNKTNTRRASL